MYLLLYFKINSIYFKSEKVDRVQSVCKKKECVKWRVHNDDRERWLWQTKKKEGQHLTQQYKN